MFLTLVLAFGFVAACDPEDECAINCEDLPAGCSVVNAKTSGLCSEELTCGDWVCSDAAVDDDTDAGRSSP
ncbi:MAG: hypothetical protein ABW321_11635 [Polyangiales bacterium]